MADNMMEWSIRDAKEQVGPGSVMMDGWELKELLGQGGFGDVWLAEKKLLGIADHSAIKIIRIPRDPTEIKAMRAEGFSMSHIQAELRRNVENAVREIRTMIDLRSHPAIVPCESFDVIQYDEDESWEIDIRMQLLKPLPDWAETRDVKEEDALRMGISLSDLLSVCEEKSILHRDIKPSNVFVDQLDNFKLGDFGLARIISDSGSTHSKGVGTEAFMAPEVFKSGKYDHRADLYSLGLVMYWLLNRQTLPFTNESNSRSQAITRRLSGEPVPVLHEVDQELDRIVRKACEADPENRWKTAREFHDALINFQNKPSTSQPQDPSPDKAEKPTEAEKGNDEPNECKNSIAVQEDLTSKQKTNQGRVSDKQSDNPKKADQDAKKPGGFETRQPYPPIDPPPPQPSKRKGVFYALIILFLLACGFVVYMATSPGNDEQYTAEVSSITTAPNSTYTPMPTPTPSSAPTPTTEPAECELTGVHQWDAGVVEKTATCVDEGIILYTCKVCGTNQRKAIPIDSNNHIGETELRNQKEATVSEEGYSGDTYCKSCEKMIAEGHIIPAITIAIDEAHFPDTVFREYVTKFDTNHDNTLSNEEIAAVSQIDVSVHDVNDAERINSLAGIEFFYNLIQLDCSWNRLTSLDISHNAKLVELNCSLNDLVSLDISNNIWLTEFDCHYNDLTSLDISNNIWLTEFDCHHNDLTSLDISNNRALEELDCSRNSIKVLDVNHNVELKVLRCDQTQLSELDVSHNTNLSHLICTNNQLTTLDVTNNALLQFLMCYGNQISSLDLSSNNKLYCLYCWSNQLKELNVKSCPSLCEYMKKGRKVSERVPNNHCFDQDYFIFDASVTVIGSFVSKP